MICWRIRSDESWSVPIFSHAYAAFLQNLLMSVLFIGMLVQRGNGEGQSLTIAVSKWLGTLAPTLLFGILGAEGFDGPSPLILTLGIFCSVFDLIYIGMLAQTKAREGLEGYRVSPISEDSTVTNPLAGSGS